MDESRIRFRVSLGETCRAEQEDIEIYGEDVEVWELWDNRGEGEIIQTHFITEKEAYCV